MFENFGFEPFKGLRLGQDGDGFSIAEQHEFSPVSSAGDADFRIGRLSRSVHDAAHDGDFADADPSALRLDGFDKAFHLIY